MDRERSGEGMRHLRRWREFRGGGKVLVTALVCLVGDGDEEGRARQLELGG